MASRDLTSRLRRLALFVLVALPPLLAIAACNDQTENERVVATQRPHDLPEWLTVKDTIEPAVWMRSREVGHDALPTDPEVDRLRRGLYQASRRFFEDPRMIANRTVQVDQMLVEAKQHEQLVDILTGMIDVADVSPNKKLYGEMCDHYLNLRRNGKDRSEALRVLMNSYAAHDSKN